MATFTAALAALLGVLLGNFLNRSAEYRKWLRSEQHVSCVAFLQATRRTYTQWIIYSAVRHVAEQNAESRISPELIRRAVMMYLADKFPVMMSGADGRDREAVIDNYIADFGDLREAAVRWAIEHDENQYLDTPHVHRTQELAQEVAKAYMSVSLVCDSRVVEKARDLFSSSHAVNNSTVEDSERRKRYDDAEREFIEAVRGSIGPTSGRIRLKSLFL